jgi:hypothetical protein
MSVTKATARYGYAPDMNREGELTGEPVGVYTAQTKRFEPTGLTFAEALAAHGIQRDDRVTHLCSTLDKPASLLCAGVFFPPDKAMELRQVAREKVHELLEICAANGEIRKGADGKVRLDAVPVAIVTVVHDRTYTERKDGTVEDLPHWHVHAFKATTCVTEDGRTGQDASLRDNYYRTQTARAAELSKAVQDAAVAMGVETRVTRDGRGWGVVGYPDAFVKAMCSGKDRIDRAILERGLEGTKFARERDQAARDRPDRARPPMDQIPPLEESRARWEQKGREFGCEPLKLRPPEKLPDARASQYLAAEIVHKAVVRAAAETASAGAGFSDVQLRQAAFEVSFAYPQVTAPQVAEAVRRVLDKPKIHGLERVDGAAQFKLVQPELKKEAAAVAVAAGPPPKLPKAPPPQPPEALRPPRPGDAIKERKSTPDRKPAPPPVIKLDADRPDQLGRFLKEQRRYSLIRRHAEAIFRGVITEYGDMHAMLDRAQRNFREYTRENAPRLPKRTEIVVSNAQKLDLTQLRALVRLEREHGRGVTVRLTYPEQRRKEPEKPQRKQEPQR